MSGSVPSSESPTRFQFSIVLATLCLTTSAALAGVNEYSSLGPEGGHVQDVEFHRADPAVIYLSASSGVYRSDDGGATWSLKKTGFNDGPYDIQVDPGDSDRIYVVADGGLYLSANRGEVFIRVPILSTSVQQPAAHFVATSAEGGVVYVPINGTVYRSTNRGMTWERRGAVTDLPSLVHSIRVHPADSDVIYASAYGSGLYSSSDGAATWQLINATPPIMYMNRFTMDPSQPLRFWAASYDGIYESVDGGVTFVQRSAQESRNIEVDPHDPQSVYSFGERAIVTTNGGTEWTPLPVRPGDFLVPGITFDHMNPARRIIFGSNGQWLTSDAGLNWESRNSGLIATEIRAFALAAGTSRVYALLGEGGIAGLGGTSVHPSGRALLDLYPSTPTWAQDLVALPGEQDTLLVLMEPYSLARSTDSGASWSKIAAPSPATRILDIVAGGATGRLLYAATSSGVFRSETAGDVWQESGSGLPDDASIATLSTTSNASVLYASTQQAVGNPSRLFKTVDGAQSWQPVNLTPAQNDQAILDVAAAPSNVDIVYVGTSSGLQRSTDGGETWSGVLTNEPSYVNGISIHPENPDVLLASISGVPSRSVDGGDTWIRLADYTNIFWTGATTLALDPLDPTGIYVGTKGEGVKHYSVRPDLALSVTAPQSSIRGTAADYVLRVDNLGPHSATNVRLEVTMPADAVIASANTAEGSCTVVENTVSCILGTLQVDAVRTVNLNASLHSSGRSEMRASVRATELDSSSDNNDHSSLLVSEAAPPPPPNTGSGGGGVFSAWLSLLLAAWGIGLATLHSRK